jgi:hypothetical protein
MIKIIRFAERLEITKLLPVMKNLLLLLCVLICISGCKKHNDNENSSQVHEFKGIILIGYHGQHTGLLGIDDGDWRTDDHWSSSEYELLNFPDTVSLNGTFIKDTTGWNNSPGINEHPRNIVCVFPNPVNDYPMLVFRGIGLLKFKATIVDKYFNRLFTFVCKDSISNTIIDLSDSTKFQDRTIYRMYYSFSTTDSLNFYKGHGDILICNDCTLEECLEIAQ